jgi:hypothetical protein
LLIVLAVVEPNAAVTEDDGAVVALSYVFLVALVMELIRLLLEAVAALSEAMLLLLLLLLLVLLLLLLLLRLLVDEDESRVFECDLDLERLLFESRCLCSLPLVLPLAPVDSNCSPAVVFGDLEEDRL